MSSKRFRSAASRSRPPLHCTAIDRPKVWSWQHCARGKRNATSAVSSCLRPGGLRPRPSASTCPAPNDFDTRRAIFKHDMRQPTGQWRLPPMTAALDPRLERQRGWRNFPMPRVLSISVPACRVSLSIFRSASKPADRTSRNTIAIDRRRFVVWHEYKCRIRRRWFACR